MLATREQAELLRWPNSLCCGWSISYAQNRAIVDFSEIYQNTSKYNVAHYPPLEIQTSHPRAISSIPSASRNNRKP